VKCPCDRQEDLRTVHSYSAGDTGSASEMICPCGKKFTFVKLLLGEIEKRGQKAYAVAQQLKRGKLRLQTPNQETADVQDSGS